MKKKLRKLPMLAAALVVAGGLGSPAFATSHWHPEEPPASSGKCNSGRGNGSELVIAVECDPGKSFTNNGGD